MLLSHAKTLAHPGTVSGRREKWCGWDLLSPAMHCIIGATDNFNSYRLIMEVSPAVPTILPRNSSGFPATNRDLTGNPHDSPLRPGTGAPVQDQVVLSRAGRELARTHVASDYGAPTAVATTDASSLDRREIQELQKLTERDTEVRIHEQAHLSAAGQFARGGASFTYQRGPDGVSYAIGGEVGIDVGKEATPEATIAKMQTIKRAALAPADPSAADRSIAAQAAVKESQARQEVLVRLQEELLHTRPTTQDVVKHEFAVASNEVTRKTPSSSQGRLRAGVAAYQSVAGTRQP